MRVTAAAVAGLAAAVAAAAIVVATKRSRKTNRLRIKEKHPNRGIAT